MEYAYITTTLSAIKQLLNVDKQKANHHINPISESNVVVR